MVKVTGTISYTDNKFGWFQNSIYWQSCLFFLPEVRGQAMQNDSCGIQSMKRHLQQLHSVTFIFCFKRTFKRLTAVIIVLADFDNKTVSQAEKYTHLNMSIPKYSWWQNIYKTDLFKVFYSTWGEKKNQAPSLALRKKIKYNYYTHIQSPRSWMIRPWTCWNLMRYENTQPLTKVNTERWRASFFNLEKIKTNKNNNKKKHSTVKLNRALVFTSRWWSATTCEQNCERRWAGYSKNVMEQMIAHAVNTEELNWIY